jgi:hypothetical protein
MAAVVLSGRRTTDLTDGAGVLESAGAATSTTLYYRRRMFRPVFEPTIFW